MLHVDNLSFSYSDGSQILNSISFQVEKGKMCGLFGPNGCGKTTLFKCCLKFLNHTGGTVHINNNNIEKISISQMARIVSYVPQEHKPPFPYLVKDVVLMGRTPHFSGFFSISKFNKQKVFEAMELIGICELANIPYNQLSGGQRQLVLIARAVAQNTPILFLDEPTSALDFSNQLKVMQILRKIADQGTTIIACTHDPNHVLWFCDSVVILDKLRFVCQGTPTEVLCNNVLDQVYENTCEVHQYNSTKMVLPRNIIPIENAA